MAVERHKCPRPGCATQVDNRLFSCHGDWFALSRRTRQEIAKTRHLPVLAPARRNAFRMAEADWEAEGRDG